MRQRGFSFFGILIFLAILGGLVTVMLKVLPPWIDFLTVSEATEGVLNQPRIGLQRNDQVLEKIDRQLAINNISLSALGKDAITLSRQDGSLVATIDYVVESPLLEREDVTINITLQFYKVHEVGLGN